MNVTDELAQKIKQVVENKLPEVVAEEAAEYSRTRFPRKLSTASPGSLSAPNTSPDGAR